MGSRDGRCIPGSDAKPMAYLTFHRYGRRDCRYRTAVPIALITFMYINFFPVFSLLESTAQRIVQRIPKNATQVLSRRIHAFWHTMS